MHHTVFTNTRQLTRHGQCSCTPSDIPNDACKHGARCHCRCRLHRKAAGSFGQVPTAQVQKAPGTGPGHEQLVPHLAPPHAATALILQTAATQLDRNDRDLNKTDLITMLARLHGVRIDDAASLLVFQSLTVGELRARIRLSLYSIPLSAPAPAPTSTSAPTPLLLGPMPSATPSYDTTQSLAMPPPSAPPAHVHANGRGANGGGDGGGDDPSEIKHAARM